MPISCLGEVDYEVQGDGIPFAARDGEGLQESHRLLRLAFNRLTSWTGTAVLCNHKGKFWPIEGAGKALIGFMLAKMARGGCIMCFTQEGGSKASLRNIHTVS